MIIPADPGLAYAEEKRGLHGGKGALWHLFNRRNISTKLGFSEQHYIPTL